MSLWEYLKDKFSDNSLCGLYPVPPDWQCHFHGCENSARFYYLDDGSTEIVKEYGKELPFFSIENFKYFGRDLYHFITFDWSDRNDEISWRTIYKACPLHKEESCWWTRNRLEELEWFEKR